MEKVPVHNTIRSLRNSRGLSQNDLAYELQISQTYYSRLERGTTELKVKELMIIARALKVDPMALLISVEYSEDDEMEIYTLEDRIKFLEGCISDLIEDRNYLREQNLHLTQIINEKLSAQNIYHRLSKGLKNLNHEV